MRKVKLRGLERDSLVKRTVYPEIPTRVEHSLVRQNVAAADSRNGGLGWRPHLRGGHGSFPTMRSMGRPRG
jgi:hypothetical protein